MSSATSKGSYRTNSGNRNTSKRSRGRPRKITQEDVSRLQDVSEEEKKSAKEVIEMSDEDPNEEGESEMVDDLDCGEIEWLLSDSELADIESYAEKTLAEQEKQAEEEDSENEQKEMVEIDNSPPIKSHISRTSHYTRTCIQCMKKQQCKYQYTTEKNGIAYLCSDDCLKSFQSGQTGKYCDHMKYLIEEITPKLLTCSECEEKKICYFYNNYNGDDFHYCSMSCLNSMMADEADKYVFKKLNIVEVEEIERKDAECCVCKLHKNCSYSLNRYGENLLVCAPACMKTLNDRENGRYIINRKTTKNYPIQSQNPPVLKVMMSSLDEAIMIHGRTPEMVQAAEEERLQTFIRKCNHCQHILNDTIIDGKLLSWEAMDFCSEVCLEMYQQRNGSRCTNCKKNVEHTSLGKFCVRFGSDIRQFCNSLCLLEYKKWMKLCCYCQRDISVDDQGFLAAVGYTGQFKHFCSQECVEKFELMCVNENSLPRLVWTKCYMCSLEKATSIEIEVSDSIQRLCSESCFIAYKHVSKIFLDQCRWCQKYFERKLSKCFTIYQGLDTQCFCSDLCMNIYINNFRYIVSCEWCKVQKYNFDMIRWMIPNGHIMICSLNCLSLYKVTVKAMASKGIRTKCQICKKNEVAQYHMTMSDASVRNFCSYQCVTTFQAQFSKNTPSLPLRESKDRRKVVPAGGPTRTYPVKKRNAVKGQQQAHVMPVISSVQSLVSPPPLTPSIKRPLHQHVSDPELLTVPRTPPPLLKSTSLLPQKSSLVHHSPLKSPSPPHSPLKSPSPPHSLPKSPSPSYSPLKSPSPPHSPLKSPSRLNSTPNSPSPSHSPLKSPSPSHSPLKSPSPSHSPLKSSSPPHSLLESSSSPHFPPKYPTLPTKSTTPPPKSATPPPPKSATPPPPKSATPPPPKSATPPPPKSVTPPPPKSATPPPPKSATPPPPKSATPPPPKSATPPPPKSPSPPPTKAPPTKLPSSLLAPKNPTLPPSKLLASLLASKIPIARREANNFVGKSPPTKLFAFLLAPKNPKHPPTKSPAALAPQIPTPPPTKSPASLAPQIPTPPPTKSPASLVPQIPTRPSTKSSASLLAPKLTTTPHLEFPAQQPSRPPPHKVYKRVNLKIVATREKTNKVEAPTNTKPEMVSNDVSCGPDLSTNEIVASREKANKEEVPTNTKLGMVSKFVSCGPELSTQEIVATREKANKAVAPTNTKPVMVSKGVSCGPELCTKETQTDSSLERRVLIPIPVPIYVPVPCAMWSSPFPVPVPIPLPIPTPVFIPTTRNSAKGIMKEINKLQDKMPTDPVEAELLMMAEMIASDQKKDESDSDCGDENEKISTPLMGMDDDNAFGEDMLQMPLMTTNYQDQPAVDLDHVVVANAIIMGTHTGAPRKRGPGLSSWAHTSKKRRAEPPPAPLPDPPREPAEKPDANMCLKYTFGVNAWKQWVMTKNAEIEKSSIRRKPFKSEILQLTADELNYSLCLFVKEVRKPNGSEYAPDTIYYLVSGIQLYLYENGRQDNIFTDPYYEKFTDCLDEVVRNFSVLYNDSQYILTRVEEEHLWESKQLGAHSPHVLLTTLMFFNTLYFNLMTVEDHMQLSFSYLLNHRKTNLVVDGVKIPSSKKEVLRFRPPHFPQETNPKKKKWYEQHQNEVNPFRCPIKLFEFYISKCPDSVRTRNDVFYLQPERSCVPDSPVWYSTQPLSRHELEKILNRIKTVKEINFVLIHS